MKTLSIAALTLALLAGCASWLRQQATCRTCQRRAGRPQWHDALHV
jgi:hypothetical protein